MRVVSGPQAEIDMTRRRFNLSEKRALFALAAGKCETCGVELPIGWHADHITPYSHGGPTEMVNGQALCAECNWKKGTAG